MDGNGLRVVVDRSDPDVVPEFSILSIPAALCQVVSLTR